LFVNLFVSVPISLALIEHNYLVLHNPNFFSNLQLTFYNFGVHLYPKEKHEVWIWATKHTSRKASSINKNRKWYRRGRVRAFYYSLDSSTTNRNQGILYFEALKKNAKLHCWVQFIPRPQPIMRTNIQTLERKKTDERRCDLQ